MRSRHIIAAAVAAASAAWVLLQVSPAAADCLGPTLQVSASDINRGETAEVKGAAFGTNCYDTGPPPEGEGVLGKPGTDIEIVFTQGDTELVVARGNADNEYSFDVAVVVPPELAPGEVTISARYGDGFRTYDDRILRVSNAAPITGVDSEVSTFGGAPDRQGDHRGNESASGGFPLRAVVLILAGLAVIVAAVTVRLRRHMRP